MQSFIMIAILALCAVSETLEVENQRLKATNMVLMEVLKELNTQANAEVQVGSKLTSDIQANLELFVFDTKSNQLVWGLRNEEGWLSIDSINFENSETMLFWSSREDAQAYKQKEHNYGDFEVLELPLDIFIEDWLQVLAEDEVFVGTNFIMERNGKEVEAYELAKMYDL